MLIDQEVTLYQLVFAKAFSKPSHILAEDNIHAFRISRRRVGLLDADAGFQGKRSGHLQNHLAHPRAEIDKRVLLADSDVLKHLLHQLIARLAVNLWREGLVLVEFIRIEYGGIVN